MSCPLCVLNVYRQNNRLKKKAHDKHSKHISMVPCVEWGCRWESGRKIKRVTKQIERRRKERQRNSSTFQMLTICKLRTKYAFKEQEEMPFMSVNILR